MSNHPVSKVLILDSSPAHAQAIRQFCEQNNLIGFTADANRVMAVLAATIDFGAILYSETFGGSAEKSHEIALAIRAARPELPIILRRESAATLDDLPDSLYRVFCAAYVTSDMAELSRALDEHVFVMIYPNALLRGIHEITEAVLSSQFRNRTVSVDTPYIVRDRLMFGEIYSLIPLESTWCRGYMVLQTEEAPLLDMLGRDAGGSASGTGFRAANSLIGEVTNLIWGAFKNRFIGDAAADSGSSIQVPIVVNQNHGYITFGSGNPELCFRYTITGEDAALPIVLYQRFAFNLHWSPEGFKEIPQVVEDMVDSGELEMF